jgi:hypothetical protein
MVTNARLLFPLTSRSDASTPGRPTPEHDRFLVGPAGFARYLLPSCRTIDRSVNATGLIPPTESPHLKEHHVAKTRRDRRHFKLRHPELEAFEPRVLLSSANVTTRGAAITAKAALPAAVSALPSSLNRGLAPAAAAGGRRRHSAPASEAGRSLAVLRVPP